MDTFAPKHQAGLNDAIAQFRIGARDIFVGETDDSTRFYITNRSVAVTTPDEALAGEIARKVPSEQDVQVAREGADWKVLFIPPK